MDFNQILFLLILAGGLYLFISERVRIDVAAMLILLALTITGVLTAFPRELIAAIAGLALLGTIGGALSTALHAPQHREAATITFLVTLSGVVIAGVGSAFWGVVAGALALGVQGLGRTSQV